jgi:hypothetical protein
MFNGEDGSMDGRMEGRRKYRLSKYVPRLRKQRIHSQRSTRRNRILSVVLACEIRMLPSRRKQLWCEIVMVSSLAQTHQISHMPTRTCPSVIVVSSQPGSREPAKESLCE